MERFLLFVALGSWMAFGQAAGVTGTVTGRVVDATTKEGIRKATVAVTEQPSSVPQPGVLDFKPPTILSTVTDAEGAYRFAGLKPGTYLLRVEKLGYLARSGRLTGVTAAAGQETAAADLLLVKQAVLSGRVTDSDGEPVEQVNVQAIPVRRSGPAHSAMTDDRGEFRIPRLAAGSYLILATKPMANRMAANVAAAGEPLMANAPTYYPSVLDDASASRVAVANGDERTGIEIRLQKTTAVRVAGKVAGEVPPNTPVYLSLQTLRTGGRLQFGAMNTWGAIAGTDGRFVFTGVTPGEYFVSGNLQRSGGTQQMSGLAKVRVGSQDVEELTVQMQPLARISGRVVAEGEAKFPYEQSLIGLRAVEPGLPGGGGARPKPDGTFVIEQAQRIRYAVTGGAPKGWYLKSIRVGGERQPGLEFEVSGAETAVEFVYSNRPGTVEVTVEGSGEGDITWVVAALRVSGTGPPDMANLNSGTPMAAGVKAVKLAGLAPGEYQIVVAPQAAMYLLGDAALWEQVKGKAAAVRVEEGGTVSATVRLMTESDFDEK